MAFHGKAFYLVIFPEPWEGLWGHRRKPLRKNLNQMTKALIRSNAANIQFINMANSSRAIDALWLNPWDFFYDLFINIPNCHTYR